MSASMRDGAHDAMVSQAFRVIYDKILCTFNIIYIGCHVPPHQVRVLDSRFYRIFQAFDLSFGLSINDSDLMMNACSDKFPEFKSFYRWSRAAASGSSAGLHTLASWPDKRESLEYPQSYLSSQYLFYEWMKVWMRCGVILVARDKSAEYGQCVEMKRCLLKPWLIIKTIVRDTKKNVCACEFEYSHTRKQAATKSRTHVTAGILLNMHALGR